MKVLVTGANGLLGSNLVRKLAQKNYTPKAMVRKTSNLHSIQDIGVEIVKGDLLGSNAIRKALNNCNVVIHAAANTSQWPNNFDNYKEANIDATQLLLEESLMAGVEKFIFVSSANTFAPGTKASPGDENSPFTKVQAQSGYMLSKYKAQKLVLNFAKEHQFPAVVVNPTFMLGKYDAKPSSGQLILMAQKRWMPCPEGGKNFVHVEDVASGIVNAIGKGKDGSCYLLANENLSYFEFFSKMKTICGFPHHQVKIPKVFFYSAGLVGRILEKIFHTPVKLNTVNAKLLVAENYYSGKKAIRNLQLPQTPIEKAIEDTLEWFWENGYLS